MLYEKIKKMQKCRNYWYIFVMSEKLLNKVLEFIIKNSYLEQIMAFFKNTVL